MDPLPLPELQHSAEERELLLELAYSAVVFAAENRCVMPVDPNEFPPDFMEERATFVTLKRFGKLRGCIGSVEAYQPMLYDLVGNAYSAAFRDPRFRPLTVGELEGLSVAVSILSPRSIIHHTDEADLLRQLRVGIDGLTIEEGARSALFLPVMWQQIPDPSEFLQHLKHKAGFPPNYWSKKISAKRFVAELIGEE